MKTKTYKIGSHYTIKIIDNLWNVYKNSNYFFGGDSIDQLIIWLKSLSHILIDEIVQLEIKIDEMEIQEKLGGSFDNLEEMKNFVQILKEEYVDTQNIIKDLSQTKLSTLRGGLRKMSAHSFIDRALSSNKHLFLNPDSGQWLIRDSRTNSIFEHGDNLLDCLKTLYKLQTYLKEKNEDPHLIKDAINLITSLTG